MSNTRITYIKLEIHVWTVCQRGNF